MATTLTISDSATVQTSVNLNAATATTIGTEWIRLPRLNRVAARVGAFPFADGQRTLASGLSDTEIEIACHIRASSVDGVEAQYSALIRLLELARQWEEHRIGTPVKLAFKRHGATNTAYWTIRSGSVELARDPDWLPAETANNILHLLVRLVVEPTAHAGALSTIRTATALTNTPDLNFDSGTVTSGDLGALPSLTIARTDAGTAWTQAYLAQIIAQADVNQRTGTVDADAYGGTAQEISMTTSLVNWTGQAFTVGEKHQYPIRQFVRMSVESGTPGLVQARYRVQFGSLLVNDIYGPWVTFPGAATGSYLLVDLGRVDINTYLKRNSQASAQYAVLGSVRTVDGSAATVRIDYQEAVPYVGLVKLSGLDVGQNDKLIYEDVQLAQTYVSPVQQPQAYVLTSAGALVADAERVGRLVPAPPGEPLEYWVYGQTETVHTLGDTFTLTYTALPRYALGLRGAG